MSAMNDGGPAFPLSVHPEHGYGPAASVEAGMSLRDWFAGKCDPSIYAPFETLRDNLGRSPTVAEIAEFIAAARYVEADAMLAQREKP